MKTESFVSSSQVEAVAQTIATICVLPAVATVQWCDQAAEAMAHLNRDAIVGVVIGHLGGSGELTKIEGVGVAGGRSGPWREDVRRRFEGTRDCGWRLADSGAWNGAVVAKLDSDEGRAWRECAASRPWRDLGALDAVVGAAALCADAPGRVILVEQVLLDGPSRFDASSLAMMRGILRPLAAKASRAFGATPTGPGRALTQREQQVLEQLTLGKSVKQIAADISRSPHTVHDHVKSLHRKLNASSRGELIARALGHIENSQRTRGYREPAGVN